MKRLYDLGLLLLFISLCFVATDPDVTREYQAETGEPASESSALIIDGKAKKVILQTSNGCGIGNFLIPSTGDPSLGIPPVLGSLSDYPSNLSYKVQDTIPGTHIIGVAFNKSWWGNNSSIISETNAAQPYIVVSDTGMFSYIYDSKFSPQYENEIYRIDAVYIPGILKMAKQITTTKTDPIVLLVEEPVDNYTLRFFSYPGLQEQFNSPFLFVPEIFEVTQNGLYLSGWDTSGSYTLYHFSTLQDSLISRYKLNDTASNAQEILINGDSIFILSSPGDSVTMLTTLNTADSTFTNTVVYQGSGARATYNEFKNGKFFTFQPTSDLPASFLDKQILILDPKTAILDTFLIDRVLDLFKHPESAPNGFGYFSLGWIGAKWQNSGPDSVFIANEYYTNLTQLQTGEIPKYINATFGCWIGIPENEHSKIKFNVHPNPATSQTVISLSGLQKGKQYKLHITDISGKTHYTLDLEAYQEIDLPLHRFPKGIYFLNLDTERNIITRKLIIQ